MTDSQRVVWMRRLMTAGGVVLFAVTWKLWTPQIDFPQIPFAEWLVNVPGWVDWIALAGIAVGLVGLGVSKSNQSTIAAILIFVAATIASVALNQHRLQPWVFLLLIHCGFLLLLRESDTVKWMRWTVASVYIFSAISKLDYQFVFTVGKQMLATLSGFVGVGIGEWPPGMIVALVLMLPLGELLVGVLLLFARTRKTGGWLAMALHGTLVLVLGPLGLDHQLGVLAWNCFFIFQVWLLFGSLPEQKLDAAPKELRSSSLGGTMFGVFVLVVPATCLLLPQVELSIRADHWVAWEVYAPRSSRASLAGVGGRTGEMPKEYSLGRPSLSEASTSETSRSEFSLSKRSLELLGVPVYPQARFQAACLVKLGQTGESGGFVFRRQPVLISETSNRLTGERQTKNLDSKMAWQRYCERHWLNLKPRELAGDR